MHTWEAAGTAHADAYQIGSNEAGLDCPTPVNKGQQVFVIRAAVRALRTPSVDAAVDTRIPG